MTAREKGKNFSGNREQQNSPSVESRKGDRLPGKGMSSLRLSERRKKYGKEAWDEITEKGRTKKPTQGKKKFPDKDRKRRARNCKKPPEQEPKKREKMETL